MSVIFRIEVVRLPSYKTVKKSPRSLIPRSGCTDDKQTDRQTDGTAMPYKPNFTYVVTFG